MRYLVGFICVLALGVVGCGDSEGTGGSGGVGGSAGDGGQGGVGGSGGMVTEMLVVRTYEADGWGVGPPLEGVEVCETDTSNCTTSNDAGLAYLELPANREISYTMTMDGHMPWMAGDVTDETFQDEGRPGYPMYPDEYIREFAEANMMAYPLTGGLASHHMNPTRTAGVTYELVDATGRVYYLDDDPARTMRFDLTATTSDGFGGFWELPAGAHQVEFGGAATNCAVALSWPGDAPNRVKVPIKVGHITLASMNCDAQQAQ
jgi:hypothetical protein